MNGAFVQLENAVLWNRLRLLRHSGSVFRLCTTIGLVLIALIFNRAAEFIFGFASSLILAVVVVGSAALFGLTTGLSAAALAGLAADYFYIPPYYELDLAVLRVGLTYAAFAVLTDFAARRIAAHMRKGERHGIHGRLDAVVDGEAYGWAFNADNPSSPVLVTLYVNDRPIAETAAVYYRPDVANLMDCSGRYGFYVDLNRHAVAGESMSIEARLSTGALLDNSPVRARIGQQIRRDEPTLLFMHIPKTAGTAFRDAILPNYKESEVAFLYPDAPGFLVRDLRQLPLDQRSGFRLVIGHFQYGIHHALTQESRYVTIVRHPFARTVSHYLYLVQGRDKEMTQQERIRELLRVFEANPTVDLDNAMVRFFGGVDEKEVPAGKIDEVVYKRAVASLRTAFAFVGHQECAGQCYQQMCEHFGWRRGALEVSNRGTRTGSLDEWEPIRQAIEHYNHWDFKLYKEILRLFPIGFAEPMNRRLAFTAGKAN